MRAGSLFIVATLLAVGCTPPVRTPEAAHVAVSRAKPNTCATGGVEAELTPDVGEWTCTMTERRAALADGRVLVVRDVGPDHCGRAPFEIIVRNCSTEIVALERLSADVKGIEPDGSVFEYDVGASVILPGARRRIDVDTRGIGVLTVSLFLRSGTRVERIQAHARVRRRLRTQ